MRALRLAALGVAIGGLAALLAAAAIAVLLAVFQALWLAGGLPGPALSDGWLRPVLGQAAALCAAGAVVGAATAWRRAGAALDARAWTACIAAGIVWGFVGAVTAEASAAPHGVLQSVALLAASLAIGALVAATIWTPVVTAIQSATTGPRRIWAGARRVASLAVGLLALVPAAPLLVVAVGVLVRAVTVQLPRDAWRGSAAALLATALALGVSVLGMHLAGVPRRWPVRPGREARTPEIG